MFLEIIVVVPLHDQFPRFPIHDGIHVIVVAATTFRRQGEDSRTCDLEYDSRPPESSAQLRLQAAAVLRPVVGLRQQRIVSALIISILVVGQIFIAILVRHKVQFHVVETANRYIGATKGILGIGNTHRQRTATT